ncbi:MAG: acyltransferase [Deltaproteobacteria bacterium]|nr:acyltransferase [Deltaproteobacteria bacterium]
MPRFVNVPDNRLAVAADCRENSIGFLRFLFAAMVLYSHSFTLGGFGPEPLRVFTAGRESLGSVAVQCFFVLSGFLITRSYAHAGSLLRYLWHRVLRIMPAFWVCLIVTAVVFGPLHYCTINRTLDLYFTTPTLGPLSYATSNAWLRMNQYGIFGMPLQVPYPGVFDGSLWSLEYEFRCYLYVAVVGVLGLFHRFAWAGLAVVAALMVVPLAAQTSGAIATKVTWLGDGLMLGLMPHFFAGALLYLGRRWVHLNRWVATAACLLAIASLRVPELLPLRPLALAYVVFWLAYRLPLTRFDGRGDFSYGFYIYAFPVQQTLALWHVQRAGVLVYVLVSAIITLALAVASYHLVERRCMAWKNVQLPSWRTGSPRRQPS